MIHVDPPLASGSRSGSSTQPVAAGVWMTISSMHSVRDIESASGYARNRVWAQTRGKQSIPHQP